jgi:LPXTG-motif cell wall-anchored protein
VIRRAVRTAALAVAAVTAFAAIAGLTVAPAQAATPASVVLVSTDGVSYQPTLSVGLFDGAGLLVPGDVATADLWIKNPLSTPATVRVNVADLATSSTELAENLRLTAVDTANGSTVTESWKELASCSVLVNPVTIPGGAVVRVSLALAMLDATGIIAQDQQGSLTANVQMRDAAAGSFPASTCDPAVADPAGTTPASVHPAATHPFKVLGYTGETFPTDLLILGAVLVGVGWFLIAARRRRKTEETQQ